MATMREEIYSKLHPILEDLVDITCNNIEKLEIDEEKISVNYVIEVLDKLKSVHPEQIICVTTPNGLVDLKIGDAVIYKNLSGEIVIDSE